MAHGVYTYMRVRSSDTLRRHGNAKTSAYTPVSEKLAGNGPSHRPRNCSAPTFVLASAKVSKMSSLEMKAAS